MNASRAQPLIGVLMGSDSDWETMQHACDVLKEFAIAFEAKVVSAHRTPDEMFAYAEAARERGIRMIIAGAGGAAHLPGMLASKSVIPVLGVPVPSKYLRGEDSLLSIVQMPKGLQCPFWPRPIPRWPGSSRSTGPPRARGRAT